MFLALVDSLLKAEVEGAIVGKENAKVGREDGVEVDGKHTIDRIARHASQTVRGQGLEIAKGLRRVA
jgi:hypothetical protein